MCQLLDYNSVDFTVGGALSVCLFHHRHCFKMNREKYLISSHSQDFFISEQTNTRKKQALSLLLSFSIYLLKEDYVEIF